MFNSKRLLILPLGLLIAISGCSGSRLRQMFAPDREFMALSELDQYDSEQARRSEKSEESLASLSEAADGSSDDQERNGFLNISRWLHRKNKDSFPPDPFLENDQSDEPAHGNTVVAVGHSNELEEDRAEVLITEKGNNPLPSAQQTADTDPASDSSSPLPTLADIMAEFEEDSARSDDLDSLAEEWLAEKSEEDGVGDFDALMADAIEDSSLIGESDADTPTLNFDIQDERRTPIDREKPDPDLAAADDFFEAFQGVRPSRKSSAANDPFEDMQPHSPSTLSGFDNEGSLDDSLWQSSDSIAGRHDPDPKSDETNRESQATAKPENTKNWDFGPTVGEAVSGIKLPPVTTSVGPARAARGAVSRRPFDDVDASFEQGSADLMVAGIDSRSSLEDPFLIDFDSQAAVPTRPAPATNAAMVSYLAPRTWLILLGGMVIAYLLFARERKNLRQPNNR